MPIDNTEIPSDATGPEPLSLTGIPSIDDLLVRMGDQALSKEVAAYVYSNMRALPKNAAKVKRAIYVAFAPGYEFSYSMTDKDIFQLAKALRGECGPYAPSVQHKAEVEAWMQLNRFMLNPRHFGVSSFATVLMYATTTTSPRWTPDGAACRVGGTDYGNIQCSPKFQAAYDKTRKGEVDKNYLEMAGKLASGQLPAPDKVYIDVGNIRLGGIEKYGDNVDGHGDYFLTVQKFFEWKPKAQIKYYDGRVVMTGTKLVFPDDPRGPLDPKGKLLDYVVANIVGTERATKNSMTDKSSIYAAMSSSMQAAATTTLQQTANVVQTTISLKDMQVATISPSTGSGKTGFQIGSDDTWSRVSG